MKKLLAVTVALGSALGVLAAMNAPALGQDGKGKAKAEAMTQAFLLAAKMAAA